MAKYRIKKKEKLNGSFIYLVEEKYGLRDWKVVAIGGSVDVCKKYIKEQKGLETVKTEIIKDV